MEKTDTQLLRAFVRGDSSALDTFYLRHKLRVYNFCLRMLGDTRMAEEALQETFLRVVRAAHTWKPAAKPTTWVFQIARNYCLDLLRKRKNSEILLDTPTFQERGDQDAHQTANPEDEAVRRDIRDALLGALQDIPEEQREVFLLREVSGLKFGEIAEVVGISENTAKSRMRYALGALRERLAETYAEQTEKEGVA